MKNINGTKQKKVAAIQLSHPGAEHSGGKRIHETEIRFKEWTQNRHKRKYVRHIGDYLNCSGERICNKPIDFWCEWEPESISKKAVEKMSQYNYQFPQNVHYPIFIPKSERKHEVFIYKNKGFKLERGINTDPFVFGNAFYYVCCQKEYTKNLKPGSLILFGSAVRTGGKRFFIDTVFVVSDIYEFGSPEYEQMKKHTIFNETVLEVLNTDCSDENKDIFVGATFDKPYNEMYSFVPCHEATDSDSFERLVIDTNIHKEVSNSVQTVKYLVIDDEAEIKNVWDRIVEKCKKEQYCLGIRTELPKEIKLANNSFDPDRLVALTDQNIRG